ncbi:MAG: sn-glycerol-3-phosphate ABC transporter ATP-binding protein UgpC [Elusimicrobia bacterium]|nr:MAG: sn-glycerol-3-phosphate ABC transporter ATP-binding protein UgpC [Elusimicrobiota bacterium]
MAAVQFKAVTKTFDTTVVDKMDLQAREGEFVVLVGPSGCGKSTSLRMLAGLETVTDGSIHIGDRDVTALHPKDRGVAMVFQDYALYPHLTVEENISLGLKVRKLDPAEITERVASAAKVLELEKFLSKKPGQLSGGQRQRVAMGRAIVKRPEVYLFDEPLSNLDAKLRAQLRIEITRLHRRMKKTVFYVTHDQVEAMTLADTIAVMNEGKIQQVGPPMELYRHPKNRFVASFIGTPQMNFLDAELDGLTLKTKIFSLRIPDGLATEFTDFPKHFTLGCRPHDISRAAAGAGTAAMSADMVEQRGAESFLHCVQDGVSIVARCEPEDAPSPGENIHLRFNLARFHYFDSETNERLVAR